jgi:hypothetical protein
MSAFEIFFTVEMAVILIIFFVSFLDTLRLEAVCDFRILLIQVINDAATADIKAVREWRWRYDKLNEVTFKEMCRKWWKPLTPEAWWEDTSFLRYDD